MSEIYNSIKVTRLTTTSNITLSNDQNEPQCIFLNSDSTNTNHWRITVNSDGKLVFDRYNGTIWVTKLDLT